MCREGLTQDEPFCTFTRRDGFKRHDHSCVPWHRRTSFCVLLPVDGHLGCLQVLVTTHKAAVGLQAQVSLQRVRISPGEYGSGAAERQAVCPRSHRAYTTDPPVGGSSPCMSSAGRFNGGGALTAVSICVSLVTDSAGAKGTDPCAGSSDQLCPSDCSSPVESVQHEPVRVPQLTPGGAGGRAGTLTGQPCQCVPVTPCLSVQMNFSDICWVPEAN